MIEKNKPTDNFLGCNAILRKHAEKFKYSFDSNDQDFVEAGQNFTQNLVEIILLSQRSNGQPLQGLIGEKFEGLDFRKCVGNGYYAKDTEFRSCYLNCGFFSQTTPFMGAVYLKFIDFNGKHNKYLASISEYGYFSIIDFETGMVLFSKEYKGYHNDDVIYWAEYKKYC